MGMCYDKVYSFVRLRQTLRFHHKTGGHGKVPFSIYMILIGRIAYMKKKTDKLFALLLAACLTATVATTSAFALNRTDPTAPTVTYLEETNTSSLPSQPEEEPSSQPDPPSSSSEPEPPSSSQPDPPSSSSQPEPPSSSQPERPSSSQPERPSSSSQPEPEPPSSSRPEPSSSSQPEPSSQREPSSSSPTSIGDSNLLPSTGSHTLSEVNSYDWNELLSNINSDGSTVSVEDAAGGLFDDDGNNNGGGGGSWLLIGGIALIVIALGGIGFVIFTQVRAHKTQVSEFPISGSNAEVTGDTIAFDPVGNGGYGDDYGDDYDYSEDGKVTPEQASRLFHESTDINSYTQPEPSPVSDQGPEEPVLEESPIQAEPIDASVPAEEPIPETTAEPEVQPVETEATPSEPEEIFSDSSMQKAAQDITFSQKTEPASSSPKKTLDDDNPFDMYFQAQKGGGETENQSPTKQIGEEDDFWDKFFKS